MFRKGLAMSQITLYLDEETEQLVRAAAEACGVSKSRWVADLIRRHACDTWPEDVVQLAGAFPDFPFREAIEPVPSAEDLPRIGF
jgi:hypothetical protein